MAEQQALRVVTAAELTLIYALEPLFATLLAWAHLGEEVGVDDDCYDYEIIYIQTTLNTLELTLQLP